MKNLIRRRRLHPMRFFDEMRDFFGSFYENFPSWDELPSWSHEHPAVDVREEKEKYRIEADLPGMTEKDVEVRVDKDVLTIASRKEEKKEGYLMRERRSAAFRRRFRIPSDKRFKKKVQKEGIIREWKRHEHFEKPSTIRNRKKKAIERKRLKRFLKQKRNSH